MVSSGSAFREKELIYTCSLYKDCKAEVHRLEKVGPAAPKEFKFFGVCIPGLSVSCASVLSI